MLELLISFASEDILFNSLSTVLCRFYLIKKISLKMIPILHLASCVYLFISMNALKAIQSLSVF
ncbi:hypothetical protein BpHYR1_018272 [Brachionus plicatilis]|uniref:Uncharacterized protein n=1 Tax=Brachionus plicatilis TaxID=10195 RepID=A0A3M7PEI7_BRAPC|nr:hypothetical protein BpHYR1_018272 [Brachionus plicatilis]